MFSHRKLSDNGVVAIRRHFDDKIIIVKYNCSNEQLDVVKKESHYYRCMSKLSPSFESFSKSYCVTNGHYITIPFEDHVVAICRKQLGVDEDTKKIFLIIDEHNKSYEPFGRYWNGGRDLPNLINTVYELFELIDSTFHKNNFIHGDLNLSNILYDSDTNKFKIIDLEYSIISIVEGIEINDTYNYNLSCYLCEFMIYNKSYVELLDVIVPMMSVICQCRIEISFTTIYDCFMNYYVSAKDRKIMPKTFLTAIVLLQTLKEFNYNIETMTFDNGRNHKLVFGSVLASKTNLDILFSHKCVERNDDKVFTKHNDYLIQLVDCNHRGESFENHLLLSTNIDIQDISESVCVAKMKDVIT